MIVRSAKARMRELTAHKNIEAATASHSGPSTSSEATQDNTENARDTVQKGGRNKGEDDMPSDHVGYDMKAVEHADKSSKTLADQTYNLLMREVDKLKRQLESSQEALGKCQGKNNNLNVKHILAALHFNYNLHRDDKVNEDDCVPLNTSYPKFKNGEATVRRQKVEQKFDYVEEPFLLYLGLSKKQLQARIWEEITEKVNALGVSKRTVMEVKEKWRGRVSGAKREHNKCTTAIKKTGAGKKPTSPLATTAKIIKLFETDPSFSSISGGIDSGKPLNVYKLVDLR
ncbi:hypothetical protein AWC38_SpisGene23219 [Stylophora pistillata]|uniref:Myb/SANT-like DNA-binding domain-containing protein n=1 Tax=Stylophora pistillata TaxID=50429 RepID=A0A2B4R8E7_STYPI|nr:hypothetical protein AWC38_SpisGene23219 [Stylophora pistillata]